MYFIHDQNPVGIIGDIHAEHESLARTIDHLRSNGVKDILCVGDIVDGFGSAEACIELLIQEKVFTVRGNHDRWLVHGKNRHRSNATSIESLSISSKNYLKNLPAFIEFETSTGRLLLCHGFGWNDMTRFVPEEGIIHQWIERDRYQWIVNGHTHQRLFKRFGEFFLVNPGTLRRDLNPGFVIIDFAKGPLRFLDLVPGVVLQYLDIKPI